MQQERVHADRYSKRQSPKELLKLSHDVKNALTTKASDLAFNLNLHKRNMTQMPAGGKFN